MKALMAMLMIGLIGVGVWVMTSRSPETEVSAHGPGEDETSVVLGSGKVTIHYGTPKLGARNLDEMIKPGIA